MTFFEAKDIALIEHELISEQDILEMRPEDSVWYLSGAHDLAEKIIKMIERKEGD